MMLGQLQNYRHLDLNKHCFVCQDVFENHHLCRAGMLCDSILQISVEQKLICKLLLYFVCIVSGLKVYLYFHLLQPIFWISQELFYRHFAGVA